MSLGTLKKFANTYCPAPILPLLKIPYRLARAPYRFMKKRLIISRAKKYLPYYQDELSREILYDRIAFLKTGDSNIFLDFAEKNGIDFTGHLFSYLRKGDYSGIVVIHDGDSPDLRYARRLLEMSGWTDKYRLLSLQDFLNGSVIHKSERIHTVLSQKGMKLFKEHADPAIPASRWLFAIREDLQYFDVFRPVDDEVVVDAGAYNGATALQFLEWGHGKVKKVYSFEFDPENAKMCEEKLSPYSDKVILVKKGTWDKDETVFVKAGGGGGSSVEAHGDVAVQLTAIDNVVGDEKVTFIKMDIEGAELKSLMGARRTIVRDHPRLAICAYHKQEDLYQLPGYLLSLVPEYRFYLRHYGSNEWETVLYAEVPAK